MIIVKDHFLQPDLCKIVTKGTEAYRWCYNHKSVVADPTHNKFFVSYLWFPSYGDNFFHILWKIIHREVHDVANFQCFRIIANGQVKGQNGNWHKDFGDRTVIYFPLEWATEWGGATYLKTEVSETEIQYQRNRLLIFDSDMLHYGAGPSIDNVLRVSIAFNLRR
jgi:hypothetical protein